MRLGNQSAHRAVQGFSKEKDTEVLSQPGRILSPPDLGSHPGLGRAALASTQREEHLCWVSDVVSQLGTGWLVGSLSGAGRMGRGKQDSW